MKKTIQSLFYYEPDHASDKWYGVIRGRSDFAGVKAHIDDMWKYFCGAGLNDPHFASEFHSHIFHRWWELEVAWYLSHQGFSLESSSSGPDFLCTKDGRKIYVECVVSEPGEATSPDYPGKLISGPHRNGEIKISHVDLPERERQELLRIRNSIESKLKQYHRHVEKDSVDPKYPYVIALSPAIIPDMISDDDGIPSIVKAVYPVGQIYLTIDRTTNKVIDGGRTNRSTIKKSNNADVRTNIFLPNESEHNYSDISGVLYSACSFVRTRHLSAMSSSFIFVHNYTAGKQLSRSYFNDNMDYWIEEAKDGYQLKNNLR